MRLPVTLSDATDTAARCELHFRIAWNQSDDHERRGGRNSPATAARYPTTTDSTEQGVLSTRLAEAGHEAVLHAVGIEIQPARNAAV